MSAADLSSPVSTADAPRTGRPGLLVSPRIVAGSLFAAAVVIVSALAAWPIYRSTNFVLLVGASCVVAGLIAVLAWRGSWSLWRVALALLISFFAIGVPVAVPSRLGGPLELLRGLGEVATGVLFGWKDLITVELPVGNYRNLLVPALFVFLVGTCAVLLLAWRSDRTAYLAVLVSAAMLSFGLFFGRASVSDPLVIGPVSLYAPFETALAVAGLVATLLWLSWRSSNERMLALRRAAEAGGVRMPRRRSRADRRRSVLGAGMLVVAVLVAALVVPYAARGAERSVLRTSAGPEVAISSAVSPLAAYRSLFEAQRADQVLFTVTAEGQALPDRVRLATLDSYDGEIFRSGGTGAVTDSRFVRVPSTLDAGDGREIVVDVEIDALGGIWLPLAGRLQSVQFLGSRAPALSDGFYYRAPAEAGVQTAGGGLTAGDHYRVRAVEPVTPELATIDSPGATDDSVAAPASLRAWVTQNVSGTGGAALQGLVDLLRQRGYLSHALEVGEPIPSWMQALPDYSFQPSASGHSLARVDDLFTRLQERATDPRAAASGNLVAAVGDDEQFSVAVALIARELGFPARVVLGARLATTDPGVSTCEQGVCRAQDLSAWTEVQSSTGAWVPIDVTPQYEQSPSLEVAEQRDPLNVTEVRPDAVEEVVPPDPVQEDSGADDRSDDAAAADLGWLWSALRLSGIVLLVVIVVLGPFVVIVAAKRLRRRARRTQLGGAARIAGGWDEYVDAATDAGRESSGALTRGELAAVFATPSGAALAEAADRAVFSNAPLDDAAADAYWRLVDEDRAGLLRERGLRGWIVATVSLRSFVRHVAPAGVRTRSTGRSRRRTAAPAR